ncbi:MAG: hypothetical protein IJW20_02640 [Clostridia bacterium]|nr:hypothetical protein [Clostridia bacterium]
MLYLVVVPFIVLAAIVKLVSDRYKLKLLGTISKVVIFIGVILFIYLFAASKGFDIIQIVINFFTL